MKLDQNGLIVTQQMDGGDTCAEEGRYWFLYWFNFVFMSNFGIVNKVPDRGHPEEIMPKLEVKPGIYVRNPAPDPANPEAVWEKNPFTTSRDQLVPVIWYCAAFKDRARLGRLFLACLKRGMFAQNIYPNWYSTKNEPPTWKLPDQMITTLGYFIRAGGWYTAILYPLLLVFDLLDLFAILLALIPYETPDSGVTMSPATWFKKKGPDSVDDNNMDVSLLGSVRFKPTPISWLNTVLWGQFRAKNNGNALGYDNNCLAAMAWYHAAQNGGNEEVTTLYSAPILKYLKKR